jgi:hypothetical protein
MPQKKEKEMKVCYLIWLRGKGRERLEISKDPVPDDALRLMHR